MYSLDDAILSVRRYLAEGLDPAEGWRIRTEREELRDEDRPVAVIEAAPLSSPRKRAALHQGPVTQAARLTVTFYPSVEGTAREASRRARRLAQWAEDVISLGLDLGVFPPGGLRGGRPVAGPDRIPLWDWAATPVEGTAEERAAVAVLPHDWLWAEDSSADAIQDPLDARRWTVPLELRVSWERPGRIPGEEVDAPVVASMPGRYVADPPEPG